MSTNDKVIRELELEVERLRDENRALLKLASHDVRSPLNKVFALVNLLKMADEPLSEEQEGYILNIEKVLADGLHRMRNLMDLRAIENNEVKIHLEEIDLGSIAKRVVRDYAMPAEQKKIKLNTSIISISVNTDKLIVMRVVDQLMSNALKFSPEGSEISIGLTEIDDALKLSVTDGGYGIAPEEQAKLFKKFKVLSTATTGGESKTGVGLFIAQEYARKLNGKISYSNEGSSVFVLELPMIASA